MIVAAFALSVVALIVSGVAVGIQLVQLRRNLESEELPSSTFLLSADQRAAMAPEVQARVFHEETLARVAKRR